MAALEVLVHLAAPLDDLLHLRFQLFNTSPSGHPVVMDTLLGFILEINRV